MLFLFGFASTNSLATSIIDILSVTSLWDDNIAKALKRFCDIVDRNHVFNLHANEKDLSGVALVAAPTRTSFDNLRVTRDITMRNIMVSLNAGAKYSHNA